MENWETWAAIAICCDFAGKYAIAFVHAVTKLVRSFTRTAEEAEEQ